MLLACRIPNFGAMAEEIQKYLLVILYGCQIIEEKDNFGSKQLNSHEKQNRAH